MDNNVQTNTGLIGGNIMKPQPIKRLTLLAISVTLSSHVMAQTSPQVTPQDFFDTFSKDYPQYNVTSDHYNFTLMAEETNHKFSNSSVNKIVQRLLTLSGKESILGVDMCANSNQLTRFNASKSLTDLVSERLEKHKTVSADLLYAIIMCSTNINNILTAVHAIAKRNDFVRLAGLYSDAKDPSTRESILNEFESSYNDIQKVPERFALYRADLKNGVETILACPTAGLEAIQWAESILDTLNSTPEQNTAYGR